MRNGVVVGLGGQICVWYAYRTVLLVPSMACVQYGVCPYGVCPYGVRRLLDVAEPYFQQAGERNGNKTLPTTLLLSLLYVCISPKVRHLISASL